MNAHALPLPLPRDPTIAPDAVTLGPVLLLDETLSALDQALDQADEITRRIAELDATVRHAGEALAAAMTRRTFGREAAIEHRGRIYRRTPDGRVTVEHLLDNYARRFAGETTPGVLPGITAGATR